ncbi:hypothetical protein LJR129_005138 [Acidovorax sp. LjRoot129]|uniref:hypothetical protein n=1 Tax=Acidovorax sp. LjRoot129 TaxID=3342260 RepID=UPI003ED06149
MAFRADEAARLCYEEAENYLVPRARDADPKVREASKSALRDIVDELGPAIDTYPSWHPLVRNHDSRHPVNTPRAECGYNGLDHTRYFVHGFITCPYGDGEKVLESVEKMTYSHHVARITAERLNVQFYSSEATPILVKCEWRKTMPNDRTIPLNIAMPLLLETELPCWEWSQVAETWESMRSYFLGAPHGSRSSLFVSQETGQAMKKIWEQLIFTGLFGPIKV